MSLKRYLLCGVIALVVLASGCTSAAPAPTQTSAQAPPKATAPTEAAKPAPAASTQAASALSGEITVGMVIALSGAMASGTLPHQNAAKLAVEEINSSKFLGNATMKLVVEDDQTDKTAAVNAFRKLVNNPDVVAVFGPSNSAQAFAAHPVAQEAKVPVFSPNSAEGVSKTGDHIFVMLAPDVVSVVPKTAAKMKQMYGDKLKSVVAAYPKDYDAGVSAAKKYVQVFQGLGLKTEELPYMMADTDFSASLTKAFASNPDMLIQWGTSPNAGLMVSQARRMGYKGIILAGAAAVVPSYLKDAGDAAETIVFPVVWAPGVPGETAKSKAFAENYQKKYNVQVEQFAAVSYDSFWLLADAIKRAGKAERGAIQQALLSTKDFNGVLGAKMNFDQDRQMSGEPVLMTWKAGKQVPFVKPD